MDGSAIETLIKGEVGDRRAIVWRRALQTEIDGLAALDLPAEEFRARVLGILKDALARGRAEVRRRFDSGASGSAVVRANCYLADQVVRVIYDHVTGHLYPLARASTGEFLSLVAVGGYGRGELAPQSDIDLLFLMPYKMTPRSEQVVEETLYFLWDLGFRVGRDMDEDIFRSVVG